MRKTREKINRTRERSKQEDVWLYGIHAVRAALQNPARHCKRLLATRNALDQVGEVPLAPEISTVAALTKLLPAHAVHQGIALSTSPLPNQTLEDVVEQTPEPRKMVVLDQVTDPINVGAVLRSCAAFGAQAVIVQNRHSPNESGGLAKAASGALELVPIVRVTNISRALDVLKSAAFTTLGFTEEADRTLQSETVTGSVALVFGAEGKGLRPLVAAHCDYLCRIGTSPHMPSLNVSNAVAVALHESTRWGTT